MFYIIIVSISFLLLISVIKGAPYLPTRSEAVIEIIKLADIKGGDRAVDLGSGDGRVVIALAEKGIEVDGYEINPFLVLISRFRIRKRKLNKNAHIYYGNFWSVDFSQYNIVTFFGAKHIMKDLEKKLDSELKPGSRVLSYSFKLPKWEQLSEKSGIYLYIKK